MQEKMVFKLILIASLMCSLQGSAVHWSIDWTSDTNFLSGNYLSKEIVQRLIKLDSILQKKINALDDEIQTNFMILMAITSLMAIILVMAAHTCLLACNKRVNTVITTKPNVSRMPVIREQHLPAIREQNLPAIREPIISAPLMMEKHQPASAPIPKEMKTTPISKNWVHCQYN